jgi:hypothetical protein
MPRLDHDVPEPEKAPPGRAGMSPAPEPKRCTCNRCPKCGGVR